MQILAWILLLAASSLVTLAGFAPAELHLPLPFGYSTPAPTLLLLAGTAICGLVAGFSFYALVNATAPSSAAVAIGAGLVLAVGLVLAIGRSGDLRVARLALLALIGGAAIEAVRREIALFDANPPPAIMARLPLWAACAALIMFAIPALLGDAAPARTGMGLCLGAGALAVAFVAVRGMQVGEVLEVTSWSGGLGGGRAGFRLSRTIGQLLLVLVLAGAAAAALAPPAIEFDEARDREKGRAGAGQGRSQDGSAPKGERRKTGPGGVRLGCSASTSRAGRNVRPRLAASPQIEVSGVPKRFTF